MTRTGAPAFTLAEILVVVALLAVFTVPVVDLLVGSREEIAGSWNETVARNLASEALEWAGAIPTDSIDGPIAVREPSLTKLRQSRLAGGSILDAPAFVRETYIYPASMMSYERVLEVTDVSPSPDVPLLRLTATVSWLEGFGPGPGRQRSVRLWRLLGP